MTNTLTKPQIVINHLRTIGRITDATARAAYGAFSLTHAVWLLRNRKRGLVPEGMKIITMERYDVAGNLFAEYRLVDAMPAHLVPQPASAYTREGAPNPFVGNRQYA